MDFQNEVLLDLFTNTPFVGFLIWQYIQQRKDYKEAQSEMKEIRGKAKEEEEKIRNRWEGVVGKLDDERKTVMSDGAEKMSDMSKDLSANSKLLLELNEKIKEMQYTSFTIADALSKKKSPGPSE